MFEARLGFSSKAIYLLIINTLSVCTCIAVVLVRRQLGR